MPLALVTQLPEAGPLWPVYTIRVAPVAFPERVSWSTPLVTEPLMMETAEPIDCEVGYRAGVERDRIGPVAQRNANQILICASKDCVGRIRWIGVRKAGPVVKITLQHPGDVETDVLVTVGEVEMTAVMSVQAGGRHDAKIGKLVGKQTLTVSQIDIEPRYVGAAYPWIVSRTWKT